jgi:hypothetical protein
MEFFKIPPDIIVYFFLGMQKVGAWRLVANPQKTAIGRSV